MTALICNESNPEEEHQTSVCYHAGRAECHECGRRVGDWEIEEASVSDSESEPVPQWEKDFDEEFYEGVENSTKCKAHSTFATPYELKKFIKQQLEKLIDDIDNYDVLYRESKRDMEYLKAKLRKELLKETND